MPPRKKKHPALQVQDEDITLGRASSLRVNLSYVSNLSDSGNGSFGSPCHKSNVIFGDKGGMSSRSTVIRVPPERGTLGTPSEMELALGKSCRILNEVTVNKTREIFNGSGDKLAQKTAMILDGRGETSMEINVHVKTAGKRTNVVPKKLIDNGDSKSCSVKKTLEMGPLKKTLKSSTRILRGNESFVLGASNKIINEKQSMVILSRIRDPRSEIPIESNISNISNISNVWDIGAPLTCSSFIAGHGNTAGPPSQRAEMEVSCGNSSTNIRESRRPTRSRSPFIDNSASWISLRGRNIPRAEKTPRRLSSDEAIPMELTSVQSHIPVRQSASLVKTRRTSLNVNTSRNISSRSTELNDNSENDGVGEISLKVNTSYEAEKSKSDESMRNNVRNNGTIISDSDSMENMSLVARLRNLSREKMKAVNNGSCVEGGPSFVEGTPYPPGRSILRKTQIRSETLETRNNVNSIPRNFAHTLGNNSSETRTRTLESDSSSASNGEYASAAASGFGGGGMTRDTQENEGRILHENGVLGILGGKLRRKKLLPLRDNFEIVSFSPVSPSETARKNPITWKPRKCFRRRKSRRAVAEKRMQALHKDKDTEDEDDERAACSVLVIKTLKEQPRVKKTRKVLSKKIVVKNLKKTANRELQELLGGKNDEPSITSETSWTNEFLKKKTLSVATRDSKSQKLVIVATGFSKGDADLIKSIAEELGGAEICSTVTRRTTHVVSTGVRTINLLRGIIRGCWMINLNWVLESLERGSWLDAEQYEMVHFSKAVQENRRDRQIFGKSYVPELFTTCGPIYIEDASSPPPRILKELVKTAGGRIAEDPRDARLNVGPSGLREIWILDSITTGDLQPIDEYRQK